MANEFGERLRRERIKRREKQIEWGARYGVSQVTVHRWEYGTITPEPKHHDLLTKDLHCTHEELWHMLHGDESKRQEAVKEEIPAFITIAEVAAMLRVSPSTAKKWANEGKIPGAFKIGGVWRIRLVDFLRYLKNAGPVAQSLAS